MQSFYQRKLSYGAATPSKTYGKLAPVNNKKIASETMPDNKKHHFVPKFYLKRFAADEGYINLFVLKTTKKVISANLRNQCYRDYFYGRDPDFEHALGGIEGEAASIFNRIAETNALPDNLDERLILLIFVLMQSARTAHAADQLNEMSDKLFKEIYRDHASLEGIDLDLVNIWMAEPARYALTIATQHYPVLVDLEVRLLVNNTGEGFITSDNPVILYNQFMSFRRATSNTGYASKGLQIFFPVDAQRALLFFDPKVYSVKGEMGDLLSVHDVRDVYAMNTLQMCSAGSNVYFHDKHQNIEAIYRKAKPFIQTEKVKVRSFTEKQTENHKTSIVMTSSLEVRTNIDLSFMRIRTSAKKWRETFKRTALQPAGVMRNEELYKASKDFLKQVAAKKYEMMEFPRYWQDTVEQAETA
jgi:hypothetical protein